MASSRHLVDPELLTTLDQLPAQPLTLEALPKMRADQAKLLAEQLALEPAFPEVAVSEHRIPGPNGAPNVRVVFNRPVSASGPLPVLVWIHGGGYVLGAPESDSLLIKTLVREVGCAVVNVDYRLAPEAPSPAGVEDCYAALKWTHEQAEALGLDPTRVAIGGSSAGGGLAAALGLLARDRGALPISFQVLLVPMLDDRTVESTDPHPYTGEFAWTHAKNRVGWTAQLGQAPGGKDVSPYAAPARAESLAGLPPTYIATGSLDLFLEEDLDFARRLTRAGVHTELHVYPGAYHGFSRAASARVSQVYRRDWFAALQRAFETAPVPQPVAIG